jgi:hypothetical protein
MDSSGTQFKFTKADETQNLLFGEMSVSGGSSYPFKGLWELSENAWLVQLQPLAGAGSYSVAGQLDFFNSTFSGTLMSCTDWASCQSTSHRGGDRSFSTATSKKLPTPSPDKKTQIPCDVEARLLDTATVRNDIGVMMEVNMTDMRLMFIRHFTRAYNYYWSGIGVPQVPQQCFATAGGIQPDAWTKVPEELKAADALVAAAYDRITWTLDADAKYHGDVMKKSGAPADCRQRTIADQLWDQSIGKHVADLATRVGAAASTSIGPSLGGYAGIALASVFAPEISMPMLIGGKLIDQNAFILIGERADKIAQDEVANLKHDHVINATSAINSSDIADGLRGFARQ